MLLRLEQLNRHAPARVRANRRGFLRRPPFQAVVSYPGSPELGGRISHDKSYEIQCPRCRAVAALEDKDRLLQTFINRALPRSFSSHRSADEVTPRERSALAWSLSISECLRQAMALHPRCAACNVLMGPGHVEAGIERFCGTHREIDTRRIANIVRL